MKTCIIISGGEYRPLPKEYRNNYVIACDKGYTYAKMQNIVPNLIIGDFDSCKEELPLDVEVMRYPEEKDDTDTMIALKTAIERGFTDMVITCGFGGRLDHLYANFQTVVYAAGHGIHCRIEDENNIITAIRNEGIRLPKREGFALSVFSASDRCRGVRITGAKYPLENAELTNVFPLGVSNEWTEDVANVEVQEGTLLVILSKIPE